MYAFHLTTAGINMHKMMSVLFQTNFCSKNNLTGKNQTFAKKRQASSLTTAALNNIKSNLGENVPGEKKTNSKRICCSQILNLLFTNSLEIVTIVKAKYKKNLQ